MASRPAPSVACRDRVCGGCTGYSGDYDTYLCGCACHDEKRGRA